MRALNAIKNFPKKTLKAKKCKKCTHFSDTDGCEMSWYKIMTFQTNIKKCPQFRKTNKQITGAL